MWLLLAGIALLCIGYFTYGKLVEKILGPDDRITPGIAKADGVDFLVLPNWRNMLIQLLNIAGVGPVIGVILGIKFGQIVFLIIPIGCIIAGATHDFIGGFMSMRYGGANLPELIRKMLGNLYYRIFSIFMCVLLLLVVAVFINVPAALVELSIPKEWSSSNTLFQSLFAGKGLFWASVVIIFIYYICATLFPVDKIIGKIYPFFGGILILGSVALLGSLLYRGFGNPWYFVETPAFQTGKLTAPIIPCLFVTIACGIISGFHATQSPIIARTMAKELYARRDFYGMMILEGIIAMIWAAGGMAIYNMFPELMKVNPNTVLGKITTTFLGSWMGTITIIAVIILAITSGDTALRSLRLSLAEIFKMDQKRFSARLTITIPLIVIVTGLLFWSARDAQSFNNIWNYFAWGNQVLAASTLMAGTAYLLLHKKNPLIALVPGVFMLFIVLTYILWVSPGNTGGKGPWGCGLALNTAYTIAGVLTLITAFFVVKRGIRLRETPELLTTTPPPAEENREKAE